MRRLFIIRKDLNLSRGKMSAMIGHCCEAYWTNLLKKCSIDNLSSTSNSKINLLVNVDSDIWYDYVNSIFTKTICEAKNLNDLKKIEEQIDILPDGYNLIENVDYGYINDKCLTELEPENEDGTTTIGIWFKPLPDEISKFLSKKYKLFDAFLKKRNCDVYKTYEEARKAYIESHNVTDTNSDMMKWLFEEYKE